MMQKNFEQRWQGWATCNQQQIQPIFTSDSYFNISSHTLQHIWTGLLCSVRNSGLRAAPENNLKSMAVRPDVSKSVREKFIPADVREKFIP
jgi:hypothetical protein